MTGRPQYRPRKRNGMPEGVTGDTERAGQVLDERLMQSLDLDEDLPIVRDHPDTYVLPQIHLGYHVRRRRIGDRAW